LNQEAAGALVFQHFSGGAASSGGNFATRNYALYIIRFDYHSLITTVVHNAGAIKKEGEQGRTEK